MNSVKVPARYLTLTSILLLATATLLLAWPRLQASYRYLPVEIAIQRYFSSREIPSNRLPVLIRFTSEAIAHQDHYRYHDGLSLLHLLRAQDLNTPALERLDEYLAAAAAAVESLRRAPAQPVLWLRLANVRWILHEESESILAPWKMSIFTGRTDTTLFAQRIEIGLAHREYLDEEALAMLRDQVLLAWKIQPGSLVGVLSRRDRSLEVTRSLIEHTDPVALADMEAWLAKLR
ncbi:MAG TPA: hypothetical protein VI566_04180 [Xanthomonadales bacterium]|nr:hypothetical protein [Xanthomonadales bacterium]